MAGSIVILDNQVRVKDSYASAPIINLTLRSNGEERVQVMDSLGQFVQAGFDAPTVAPTANVVVAPAPGMTQPKWVYYRYVYAATKRYPLVENAVTAGGNLSPRSNPSPSVSANINAANRGVDLTVTYSTRQDVTAIWIYRTDYFDSIEEANQASEEGTLHYVDSIPNLGTTGTATYADRTTVVTGNELIEFDNFVAEQFALCVYADPYFYGFANFEFRAPITVDATGLVTLTNPWSPTNLTGDKWYDGRNRQIVKMVDITNGGFDGFGSFYFKWIDNQTAQLCFDLQLLQNAFVPYAGTTTISIMGPATNLYRSKPRNPFSWGLSILIGEIAVPQPYVHRVGGGQGTAICVVPVLNLLKVDTEGPNKTYVFNLKSQGTEDFERSQQEISSDYSASNHWCQFPAKTNKDTTLLWFLDNKYGVVCQTDGSSNQEVSGPIYQSIRNLSDNPINRLLAHGAYDPRTQLSIIWVTTAGGDDFINNTVNDLAVLYHHPTNTWSTLDQKGILCSAPYLDRETNEQMILVGSENGRIGRMFAPNVYWNWIQFPEEWPRTVIPTGPFSIDLFFESAPQDTNLVGLWLTFAIVNTNSSVTASQVRYNNKIVGWARISIASYDAGTEILSLQFDVFRRYEDGSNAFGFNNWFKQADANPFNYICFLETIVCNSCKTIDTEEPTKALTLAEVWVTKIDKAYPEQPSVNGTWSQSFHGEIILGYRNPNIITDFFNQISDTFEFLTESVNRIGPPTPAPQQEIGNNLFSKKPIALDMIKNFSISLYDVGYSRAAITNLQLVVKQKG